MAIKQTQSNNMLSWRNVLDCKVLYGDVLKFRSVAALTGYEYFCWNDRIYEIDNTVELFHDTGLTVNDIK